MKKKGYDKTVAPRHRLQIREKLTKGIQTEVRGVHITENLIVGIKHTIIKSLHVFCL